MLFFKDFANAVVVGDKFRFYSQNEGDFHADLDKLAGKLAVVTDKTHYAEWQITWHEIARPGPKWCWYGSNFNKPGQKNTVFIIEETPEELPEWEKDLLGINEPTKPEWMNQSYWNQLTLEMKQTYSAVSH